MSASKQVTIMCDAPSCGVWWDAGIAETATQARRQLRGSGWQLNVLESDGWRRDYCPKHNPHRGSDR